MNEELARILKEYAVLMELLEQNAFKIRAYVNAARTLERSRADLPAAVRDGTLAELPGIGKGIQELIKEYIASGRIAGYEEAKENVDPGLLEMTTLKGVGAKKVLTVYKELDVKSVGELEYACRENRLVDLKGFGAKTQAKILDAIDEWNAGKEAFHLDRAVEDAQEILDRITTLPCVKRAAISGLLRRVAETIKSIDLLVVCSDREELRTALAELLSESPQDEDGYLTGTTGYGIPLRVELCRPADFAWRLHQSSAADEYQAAFVDLLKQRDIAAGEDGLEREGRALTVDSEEELYGLADLPLVPVELRESPAILRTAAGAALPDLVGPQDMRGMLHIHSTWSDGRDSLRDMALATKAMGYSYIAFCDHSRSAFYANGLQIERLEQQHAEIDALNSEDLGIRILKGIESDILPNGDLDYPDEILASFDIVVASVHSVFSMTEEAMTNRILKAIQNPYTTILGHPTGRLLLARKAYPLAIDKILEAAADHAKVIEINANPYRLDLAWPFVQRGRELGIKFAVNPDAHRKENLRFVDYGLMIARKGMLSKDDVINTYELDRFLQFVGG